MNVANEKPAPQLVDKHREHDDNQRSSSRWSPWLRAPRSRDAGVHSPAEAGDPMTASGPLSPPG